MCRFPTLLENELTPDEGQFLASAHKLFYDANFFRSVDCGTSGPINIYPLVLPAIFGFTPDFASSRVLVLLIILLSTYLLYRTVALIAPDDLARVASLSFFGAFAVFRGTELVHYSSEHTPILLISVALYCSVRVLHNPHAYGIPVFLLGLLACTAFFTKMQSVPIIAALAGVALAFVYATGNAGKLWRPVLLLFSGVMPLLIINAILCIAGGVWKNFWISYIVSNWNSPNPVNGLTSALPEFVKFAFIADEVRFFVFTVLALAVVYWLQSRRGGHTREWKTFLQMVTIGVMVIGAATFVRDNLAGNYSYLFFIAMAGIPMYLLLFFTEEPFSGDRLRWFGFLALASVAAAFFSAYAPHRPFFHYLLFLFLPLCTVMTWMLIRQCGAAETSQGSEVPNKLEQSYGARRRIAFVSFFAALIVAYQSYMWSFQDNGLFKHPAFTIRPPEGDFIRSLTDSKAKIAVWGWTVRPYLGSGRVPATRDTNTNYAFRGLNLMTSPPVEIGTPAEKRISRYYRQRFLHDLRLNRAELLIDATGPTSWFLTDSKLFTFEKLPEIDAYVKANYVYLVDLYGQRYFLRRDLASKREQAFKQPLPPKTCTAEAVSCMTSTVILPKQLPPVQMPSHALLEAEFMPVTPQIGYATVFSKDAVTDSYHGFQFQHVADDRYRLILGIGDQWTTSKEIFLPQSKPVMLSIELNGKTVSIHCNGAQVDEMHLVRPMADAGGPITLNSWIEGERVFSGRMQFFQIVDLEGKR
jgi:hypothetical protein